MEKKIVRLAVSGHKSGRNGYITPAFSGVPNAKQGNKIRRGCSTTTTFWAPRWVRNQVHHL